MRIAPIDMPAELKARIEKFAHENGGMAFAAAVRYLLIKALDHEERE